MANIFYVQFLKSNCSSTVNYHNLRKIYNEFYNTKFHQKSIVLDIHHNMYIYIYIKVYIYIYIYTKRVYIYIYIYD